MRIEAPKQKEVIAAHATVNFETRALGKSFATQWTRRTLTGHSISPNKDDGSVDVMVYKLSQDDIDWVKEYIGQ